MKTYYIHYPDIKNMGDLLNKTMLEELFHIIVQQSSVPKSNLSAIGSGLDGLFWAPNLLDRLRQLSQLPFANTHYIWGTGFISDDRILSKCIFKDLEICALRGKLTKSKLEKCLGKKIKDEIALGDGGLLASRWVSQDAKKYAIGLIPHFREQDHPQIKILKQHYSSELQIIDLKKDPKSVIKQITQCETIISSSLHGLIIADSFHIPNLHVLLYPFGTRIKGDGFKYRDYYSAFGMEDRIIDISNGYIPKIMDIKNNYLMNHDAVEEKIELLKEAFPL